MDLAPALPPSQEALPVFVSNADTFPQEVDVAADSAIDIEIDSVPSEPAQLSLLPSATPQLAVSQPLHPALTALPARLLTSLAGIEALGEEVSPLSARFVSVSGLSNSFNFVSQAFRSARIGNRMDRALYSAAVPVQWVSQDSWKGRSLAADIQVKRVDVSAEVAQRENSLWSEPFIDQCMPGTTRQLTFGERYKVSLGSQTLGYVADEKHAYLLAQQLKRLIRQASFNPHMIAAYPMAEGSPLSEANALVGTSEQPLFAINDAMSTDVGYSPDWAAVSWANNLRLALNAAPLLPGEALMGLKGLEESKLDLAGEASWYGPYFHGRATANGETYDQYDLTVAHKSLPFGTQLKVRNVVNDKTVVVRVNDRGPYVGDRILDLSRAAADCLGSDDSGVVPVEATLLREKR